jgi:hypothetical protein
MQPVATITGNMAQAIGTTKYIRHFSRQLVFTDGIEQLREDADCHWLVDAIASHQVKHKHRPFQVWELEVKPDNSAVLTMKEDTGWPVLVRQEIKYTDFPLSEITLWVEEGYVDGGSCPVLLLPNEH